MSIPKSKIVGKRYLSGWIRIKQNGFFIECCGCGLKHRIDFRVVGGKHIELRARFKDGSKLIGVAFVKKQL